MTFSNTLQEFLQQYALLSLEKQDKLESLIDEQLHELDPEAGKVRFGEFEFSMQILGTESGNTLTWLWAWADEHTEVPASLLQSAIELRNWGAGEGIKEFTMPSVDLNRVDGHTVAMIGAEVCKASCYYQDSYEGGAVFLLLFDRIIDSQPSFDRERLVARMADLFSRYDLNHRNTLLSYLTLKGLSPIAERNLISCELGTGERLNVEFDESGRLMTVNGAPIEGWT
jgi:hypothetical protein